MSFSKLWAKEIATEVNRYFETHAEIQECHPLNRYEYAIHFSAASMVSNCCLSSCAIRINNNGEYELEIYHPWHAERIEKQGIRGDLSLVHEIGGDLFTKWKQLVF